MLIVDNRTGIPFDVSRLDWNLDRVSYQEEEDVISIPLNDPALHDTVEEFAYSIGSRYPWAWPDLNRITVALQIDMSRSYFRFALVVGVKPSTEKGTENEEEWEEFEKQRQQAIEASAGQTFYDTFPVMLTVREEEALRRELYNHMVIQ